MTMLLRDDNEKEPIHTGVFVMDDHFNYYQAYEVEQTSCQGCAFNGARCNRPSDMDFVCEDVGETYPNIIWVKTTRKAWYDSYSK